MKQEILIFVFLLLLWGCSSKKRETTNIQKGKISIRNPAKLAQGKVFYVPFKKTSLLIKGDCKEKGENQKAKSKGLSIETGKGTLSISGYSFEIRWALQPGLNQMVLKGPSSSITLQVYRYTEEVEKKLALLEKGLKEAISLPPLEYEFRKNVIIEPQGSLKIEAGAVLKFYPRVGIDVYGELLAQGREKKTIVFQNALADRGWRNISVGGPKARARLVHCSISGGRGASYLSLDRGRFSPEEGLVRNHWTIGGGLLILERPVQVEKCKIFANKARNGGGVYLFRCSGVFRENDLYRNKADYWGGGLFVMQGKVAIRENHFVRNQADIRGGGLALVSTQSRVVKNVISENISRGSGGGGFCQKGKAVFSNNKLMSNRAESYGGALALFESSAQLEKNTLSQNWATLGGGFFVRQGHPIFHKNIFQKNHSSLDGGGGLVSDSHSTFWQNKWAENQAGKNGGALCSNGDYSNFAQNRFKKNRAGAFGGAMFFRNLKGGSLAENEFFDNSAGGEGGSFAFVSRSPLQQGNIFKGNRPSRSFQLQEKQKGTKKKSQ